jgi:hypothetical protein
VCCAAWVPLVTSNSWHCQLPEVPDECNVMHASIQSAGIVVCALQHVVLGVLNSPFLPTPLKACWLKPADNPLSH